MKPIHFKNRFFPHVKYWVALFILATMMACEEDDNSPEPISVNFTNTASGITIDSPELEASITFSRSTTSDGTLTLSLTEEGLNYGEDADYYTEPKATDGTLTLNYSSGAESVSFKVISGKKLNIKEDKKLSLKLNKVGEGMAVGKNNEQTITFAENFAVPSGLMEMNAGGASFPNQSFVDISRLKHTSLDKTSWDLGFYSAAEGHHVILNNSGGVMARPLEKTDMNAVTATDTVGFRKAMVIGIYSSPQAIDWVDSPDGNLDSTAFGKIDADDSKNKVFIVKDASGEKWKKVRVLQNGDHYTLQYADISASTFTTQEIKKDNAYNFTFFDFDNGEVSVEPKKQKWDLMYGTYTEVIPLVVPYTYKDFIIINRNNTSVALVMIDDQTTYENFTFSGVKDLTFSSEIDAIGERWRRGGGPMVQPKLYTDRFFVIKDAEKRVYKVKFTRLLGTDGERGKPELIFELLQP